MSPPAATYMRPGAGLYIYIYIYCRYGSVRPRSLPAESHSFVGMARETAAMPPAYQRSFTSIQMVHTHTHIPLAKKEDSKFVECVQVLSFERKAIRNTWEIPV